MSGAELALAIVPLVIVLVEHHQTVIRKGKALAFPRSKNEQQLDFYHELHDELCLLKTTLNRVKGRSTLAGHIEEQEAAIKRVLGSNAPHFDKVLDRILRSINDLVSDKSVALVQEDVVSAPVHSHGQRMTLCRTSIIRQRCYRSSIVSSKPLIVERPLALCGNVLSSRRTRKVVQLRCIRSRPALRSLSAS